MPFDVTSRCTTSDYRSCHPDLRAAAVGSTVRASAPFLLLLAMVLILAACGGSSSGDAAAVSDAGDDAIAEPAPAPTSQPEVEGPPPFPATVVATSDGGQIDFGSLAGQDTVLWFWAPW